ncbi:hypothetical protein GCM10009525_46400 [Streptosporangium amethystogenes subsp. fukuiense]
MTTTRSGSTLATEALAVPAPKAPRSPQTAASSSDTVISTVLENPVGRFLFEPYDPRTATADAAVVGRGRLGRVAVPGVPVAAGRASPRPRGVEAIHSPVRVRRAAVSPAPR